MLIRTNDVFACHYVILDVHYDVEASVVFMTQVIFLGCSWYSNVQTDVGFYSFRN